MATFLPLKQTLVGAAETEAFAQGVWRGQMVFGNFPLLMTATAIGTETVVMSGQGRVRIVANIQIVQVIDLKTKITSLSWGRTGLVELLPDIKLALCDGGKVTVYGPTETQWEEYFSFVVPFHVNSLNWVCNDDYLVSLH